MDQQIERISLDLKYSPAEAFTVRAYLQRRGLKAGPYVRALLLELANQDKGHGDKSSQAPTLAQK